MPYFPKSAIENRAEKTLFPGVVLRTFWGEQSLTARVQLDPHAVAATHQHPHEQTGVIVEGELTMHIGDESMTLHPGEMYIVLGNTPHSAVAGPEGCVAFEIFAPVRESLQY